MEIRVSVRQLVEFILREGNIDNRRTGGSDTAMQEGGRIHRMIQRRMGSDYHAEVMLRHVWKTQEYDVVIEGRADGIIDTLWNQRAEAQDSGVLIEESAGLPTDMNSVMDEVVIDEIKGTYRDLKRINKPVGVHLAQAKCYAYIYASQNGISTTGVRMTPILLTNYPNGSHSYCLNTRNGQIFSLHGTGREQSLSNRCLFHFLIEKDRKNW